MDMPRRLPADIFMERTRHGKTVFYCRRGKAKRIRVLSSPTQPDWQQACETARQIMLGMAPPPKARTVQPTGSLHWLWNQYRASAAWQMHLKASTRAVREAIMVHILSTAGQAQASAIRPADIVAGRDKRLNAGKPAAAKDFIKVLRGIFTWAVGTGLMESDPTAGIRVKMPKTEGYHVWTEEEREIFRNAHPLGTMPRLAFEIYSNTGIRRGDAALLGRQHIKIVPALRDRPQIEIIEMNTEKTGEPVFIVVSPDLRAAIAAMPTHTGTVQPLTLIHGINGRSMAKESLGTWFGEHCKALGIKGRAHGLRKALATDGSNLGLSEAELDALFGWRGRGMAALYTKKANRRNQAISAALKVQAEQKTNTLPRTLIAGAGFNQIKPTISDS